MRPVFKTARALCATILLGCLPPLGGADLHVSERGDNAQGGTEVAPLRTVAEALARSHSGDRILLERGSVFREGGLVLEGNRTLTAYGDPAQPLPALDGSSPVTGFTPWASDPRIWTATIDPGGDGVAQLYLDGALATLARYPDRGWLRTENGTTTSTIVDASLGQLPGATPDRWTGAQVRWRKWSWWYETRPVTADNGAGQLTLGGTSNIPGLTGIDSGYYLDQTLAALDAPGEWFWDAATHILYLIPPAGASPDSLRVEAAWRPIGLHLRSATIDSVAVRHYTGRGIELNRTGTIRGCEITHIGDTAISATWDCAGSLVSDCLIRDILNVGIGWNENPSAGGGSVIERNTLVRIGTRNGLGGSGPWHAAGIILYNANETGSGVEVRLNRIADTGYAGIIVGPDFQTIRRNVFRRCMNTLNDGAAIYTNSNHSIIHENIVLETIGDMESAQPFYPLGHGIWLEFLENFADSEVVGNTVYGCGGNGLFLPNNYNCLISENTFFANRLGGIHLEGNANGPGVNSNHTLTDNLVGLGPRPWQPGRPENLANWAAPHNACLSFEVDGSSDFDYGAMSGTIFVTTDGQDLVRRSDGQSLSLASWTNAEAAWADPSPTAVVGDGFLFINDTEQALDFPLPGGITWHHLDGRPAGPSVALAPFRSIVMLAAAGDTRALAGYALASELDRAPAFPDWIARYGYYGDDALPRADPENDGHDNLTERFFHLDPTQPEGALPVTLATPAAGQAPALRLTRARRLEPGAFEVLLSDDLASWTPLAEPAETVVADDPPEGTETVEIPLPGGAATRFARLRLAE